VCDPHTLFADSDREDRLLDPLAFSPWLFSCSLETREVIWSFYWFMFPEHLTKKIPFFGDIRVEPFVKFLDQANVTKSLDPS